MPVYRTHVTVNLLLGLPLSLAALKYSAQLQIPEVLAFALAFTYGTLFLHPDLDLVHKIKLFSLRGILTLPFRPYSLIFKHRGISHIPIIGTLTRVLWLLGLFWVFALPVWTSPFFWFALSGLAMADLCHIFLDFLST